jgi:protein transport protein SEC23
MIQPALMQYNLETRDA